jgi:alpha-1,2-mannosyltransferase
VVYGVLGVELAVIIWFAATYNALDFRIYMWGGHAVLHDERLYQAQAFGHWFTYSPFAAVVFVPLAALPLAVVRVAWDLVTVAALAYSCLVTLRLAGYRPTRVMTAGVTAAALALDPMYQTLFLGQINLILLALILTDVWRVSRGRGAGILVGVAAAIKLTPAIFIVFFLVARRTKAAVAGAVTFLGCGLIGWLVAPGASVRYWEHLSHDTSRVGAPYISNQSPYAAAIRIAEGAGHVGSWYIVIPVAFAAIGLTAAAVLARHGDWLGAATVTGTTGLLVSPISWAHHWVWIVPALVLLVRDGHRIAAALGYLLFLVAPFWYTPHSGGPREYGFHGPLTLAANCYLLAGLAFLGYMARRAYLAPRRGQPDRKGETTARSVEIGILFLFVLQQVRGPAAHRNAWLVADRREGSVRACPGRAGSERRRHRGT